MTGILIAILFTFLLVLSFPVAFCMLITSVIYILITGEVEFTFIPLAMISGSSNIVILAVPFFMLVGEIMNAGGITKRIYKFSDALVGHITGGLGHVNVLSSLIFSGVSGSALADAVGLGTVEINAMVDKGYDADFSVGVTAASSIIGPIFPPSTPMVLFGVFAGVSIGSLFLAGITVGVSMAVFMMVVVYIVSKNRNYPIHPRTKFKVLWSFFKEAFWALIAPIMLVLGIVTGIATPTEISAVAVFYSIIVGAFVYKELTFKKLLDIFKNAIENIGMVMLLIAAGTVFGWVLGVEKVADSFGVLILSIQSKFLAILIINLFLLFLGMFMSTTPALIISVPILMPVILKLGIHPVQFGVAMLLNILIGLITPPMALCLFVTAKIGKISFERAFKAVIPYYVAFLLVIFLIYVFPELTLWLPRLVFGKLTL